MYPKNAASPQRIAIGAVVLIADGTVQTSGVSVKVLPQGTTASAGGGTIAYEEGIVHYLPTQAETNYASFIVIAYKTACIPVSATIVTSASGVAGYAGLDWATINAPTTTQGLSGTTVGTLTTYTGNTPQTGDAFARLGAPAGVSTAADIAAVKAQTAAIEVDTGTDLPATLATIAGYLDTEIAAIKAKTDNLPADPADASDIASSFTTVNTKLDTIDDLLDTEVAAIKSDTAAIKAKTDNLPTDPADQSAVEAAILAAWTTALTEAYRANGATGTPAQLLYEIAAHLSESAIAGTTKTIKKVDHSTTAATFTLDDAVNPTSITRAT